MSSPLVHLELHTADLPLAGAFYEALCGWRLESIASYHALSAIGPIGGGIVESSVPRAVWLPYVAVPDIGQATDRAEALGARVAIGPREGPAGWRTVLQTPAAGELALWQPKR